MEGLGERDKGGGEREGGGNEKKKKKRFAHSCRIELFIRDGAAGQALSEK